MTRRRAPFWTLLAIALLVSVGIRVWLACSASCIARDGLRYTDMARRFEVDWRSTIAEDLHAGLPAVIWLSHGVLGPSDELFAANPPIAWQKAGQRVVLVFGVLSILAMAGLSHLAFGPRVAGVCTLAWAFLPDAMQLSADVLSDIPHIALAVGGLAALLAALQRSSLGWLFACGLCSGAAYTFRPEGGEVVLLAVVLWGLQRSTSWRRRGLGVLAVCLGFAVLGGSYILLEGGEVFSKKPLVPAFAMPGLWTLAVAEGGGWLEFAQRVSAKWAEALQGIWAVLAVAGLLLRHRPRARPHAAVLLASLAILHLLVVGILWRGYGYLSSRHLLYLVVVTLPLAACGLIGIGNALDRWRRRRGHRPWRRRWDLAVTLLIAAVLLPWSLRDIGDGRGHVVAAGEWIGQHYRPDEPLAILAEHAWVPFYANRYADWCWARDAEQLLARIPRDRTALVVAQRLGWLPTPAACQERGLHLEPVAEFGRLADHRGAKLYQVVFEGPRPAGPG